MQATIQTKAIPLNNSHLLPVGLLRAPFFAVGVHAFENALGCVNRLAVLFFFEECYDVVYVDDGVCLDAVFVLHGLECGLAVLEFFLAVDRNEEPAFAISSKS